jgi:hypothetical protein
LPGRIEPTRALINLVGDGAASRLNQLVIVSGRGPASDKAGEVVIEEGDGRAGLREVKIGHLNEDYGEVTGGLAKGARVILNPSGAISDGTRVALRE